MLDVPEVLKVLGVPEVLEVLEVQEMQFVKCIHGKCKS